MGEDGSERGKGRPVRALDGSKQGRNGLNMPRTPSQSGGDHFWTQLFLTTFGPKIHLSGVPCGGVLPPPPCLARYGVLRGRWGRSEGWKPPKLGGCTQEKCPRNRDSGRPAQDTAISRFRTTSRLAGCPPPPPLPSPVRGPTRALGPF